MWVFPIPFPLSNSNYTVTTVELNVTITDTGLGVSKCWYWQSCLNFRAVVSPESFFLSGGFVFDICQLANCRLKFATLRE